MILAETTHGRSAYSANITVQAGTPAQPPGPMPDQEINDWDVFYQLLLSSKLNQHGGEFVVIHQGKIVANGADPALHRVIPSSFFAMNASPDGSTYVVAVATV